MGPIGEAPPRGGKGKNEILAIIILSTLTWELGEINLFKFCNLIAPNQTHKAVKLESFLVVIIPANLFPRLFPIIFHIGYFMFYYKLIVLKSDRKMGFIFISTAH